MAWVVFSSPFRYAEKSPWSRGWLARSWPGWSPSDLLSSGTSGRQMVSVNFMSHVGRSCFSMCTSNGHHRFPSCTRTCATWSPKLSRSGPECESNRRHLWPILLRDSRATANASNTYCPFRPGTEMDFCSVRFGKLFWLNHDYET